MTDTDIDPDAEDCPFDHDTALGVQCPLCTETTIAATTRGP